MAYRTYHTPRPWGSGIPLIGDDLAKIGAIVDLYAAPCSPTAEIWVYGFFQAIPTLAASLLKPEIIDINIKHRRGKPRKGKKFKFDAGFFFRDAIVEIPVPRWVVFRVYELSQRIGWYFLVADATEDFTINWMTAAYKYNGCNLTQLTYLRNTPNHAPAGGLLFPGDHELPKNITAASQIEAGPGHFGLIIPGSYRVTWTANFDPYFYAPDNSVPYTTYLKNITDGQAVEIGEVGNAGNGKRYASGTVMITLESGRADFAVYGSWSTPGICFCDLTLSVDLIDPQSLGPDP